MKPGVARLRAAMVVRRVTDEGAHSNVLVNQLDDLGPRDRAAAQRLAMDTLRYLPRVDALITQHSNRPLDELDPTVRATLRVALAELITGGDAHGVVDSAVEAVRRSGQPRATGFTNAILRNVIRKGVDEKLGDHAALSTGTPPWIRRHLGASWGLSETDAFLTAALEPAPIGVRLRPGADAQHVTPTPGIPHAGWVDDRGIVDASMMVMDPASTAVVAALGVEPGHRVLDMAAAPGNKTSGLVDALAGEGLLVATDRHARRLSAMQRRFQDLGPATHFVVADGRQPPFAEASFDRVLLDAPCTGLGTLRRRPEIKTRLVPDAPARLGVVQRSLLEAGLQLVRPGGRLVYSVCTVFDEETAEVIAGLGGRPPTGLPGRPLDEGWLLAPHLTETDGMFITVFDR